MRPQIRDGIRGPDGLLADPSSSGFHAVFMRAYPHCDGTRSQEREDGFHLEWSGHA